MKGFPKDNLDLGFPQHRRDGGGGESTDLSFPWSRHGLRGERTVHGLFGKYQKALLRPEIWRRRLN